MILVVGSTGVLGGMIARLLLQQGLSVRILVRPGSSYAGLVELGAEPSFGDLKEPDSLGAACRGVDTVITTANSALRGGADTVETVDRKGNRNLIDAARTASVQHFIFVSALGVSEESGMEFMRAKAETERYLRDSGLGYTILQPNAFMDTWIPLLVGSAVQAGQPVTLVGEGRRRHSMIAAADVAAFTIACVEKATLNRSIPLGGPEAVSWHDIVAACERALGHPLEVRRLALGESIPGLPDLVSQFAAALESYDSPLEMAQTSSALGVRLTPVEEFVTELLAPAGRP
ncbi:MAG: SDR family oxidoreductase [Gemmatimonadales bacterium]|nr:SDR family oxidoreductase [Gemmatimonadales bacterium]